MSTKISRQFSLYVVFFFNKFDMFFTKRVRNMNEELKKTVLKVAEFSNEDKLKLTKRMHKLFI